MYDIKKVRKTTIIKLVFMTISFVIPIILYFLLGTLLKDHWTVGLDVQVIRILILVLAELFILSKDIYYIFILKSDKYAMFVMTKKNDERLIFIRQKYSTYALKQILFLLVIGIVVSGFINEIMFYTLVCVLMVFIITTLITYIYYKKKY